MRLADQIQRIPRAYDPQKGAEIASLVPELPTSVKPLVVGAAGCSPYLAGLIQKEADWLPEALEAPDVALAELLLAPSRLAEEDLSSGLRQGKRRLGLLAALADLAGAWPLEKVTGALSDYAGAACSAALISGVTQQIRRGKVPGMVEEDAQTAAGMCVLAMGKMGALELNYSSDIDLICLFDETRFDAVDYHDARQAFVRATRAMCGTLSEMTAQGYVFRTDLRLRPDPAVTPVCIAMEAAENYYESLGRTWERAAYIKANPAAGDTLAGQAFLKRLTPFVWRRHLDFAAIQDAHDMRLAIRTHKGLGGPITLPGHNMKLGRGGIREIEFFTQTRQLIAGGRDPDLRCRGTVAGLHVLARKGWVDPAVASALQDYYVAHRTVEHRLQMVQDAQTHSLPRNEEDFDRLACMMDMDAIALKADLSSRLEAVHEMTEGFFAPDAPRHQPQTEQLDHEILDRWVTYPALRSARSREIFERVKPLLLDRLAKTAKPHEALLALDGFLSGLPAGVQLFSLFEANPQLIDLLVDITGTTKALAHYLSRNASVFDAVIAGDFFSDWPGEKGLVNFLQTELGEETDYERKLDAARRWTKEWNFRIGVHLLRGLSDAEEAGRQYTDLARAVVQSVWPEVCAQFALKHGPPPGRGAVILGMGSLGAGTLNAGSDLDLIVIYDPLDEDMSVGEKPLSTRPYYARLTQAMITALSAPMSQGKLYDVDMRLRPSGNQGPVATSWQAFQSYQREEAWVWEHLALTRAQVVAGPSDLATDVESLREEVIAQKRDLAKTVGEVVAMRRRIQEAKTPEGVWDVKIGAGRLQDIEIVAQTGILLAGLSSGETVTGLKAAQGAGVLSNSAVAALTASTGFFSQVHTVVRLLSASALKPEELGPAGEAFLCRALGNRTVDDLEAQLASDYLQNAAFIEAALAPFSSAEDDT